MATTYRKLAEETRNTFYSGQPSDDASFSLRHFAELIANEVAFFARQNAFENSNMGEVTYANDSFTVTYKNLAVLTDSVLQTRYTVLPDIPASLPNNAEIVRVWPVGVTKKEIIPMKGKDKGVQDLLEPLRNFALYYPDGANIYYDNYTAYNFSAVNMSLVAAVPQGDLLSATLNLPRNYQTLAMDRVLQKLDPKRFVKDLINDSVDRVTQ